MPAHRLPARTRVIGALATAALIASVAVSATATPAAAAGCSGDPVARTWSEPTRRAIGTSKTQSVDLIVATRGDCAVKTVKVAVTTRAYVDRFALSKYATESGLDFWGVTYDIAPTHLKNVEAAAWQTDYTTTGAFGSRRHSGATFRIVRAAKVSVNAKPEPIRKGRTLTVTGTLTRANWETRRYTGYGRQKVQLQWRSPKGRYGTVKTVTARSDGSLRTSVKATRDGCYRFVFGGNPATGSATATGDCVDVRG